MTKVVHCKIEPYDIYIGRPSEWGNPFSHLDIPNAIKCQTRDEAVARYKEWLLTKPELLKRLPELKGKILGCWCSPNHCHGHILAEMADAL